MPLALITSLSIPQPGNFLAVTRYGIPAPAGAISKSMSALPVRTRDEFVALADFARWQFADLPAWDRIDAALDEVLAP